MVVHEDGGTVHNNNACITMSKIDLQEMIRREIMANLLAGQPLTSQLKQLIPHVKHLPNDNTSKIKKKSSSKKRRRSASQTSSDDNNDNNENDKHCNSLSRGKQLHCYLRTILPINIRISYLGDPETLSLYINRCLEYMADKNKHFSHLPLWLRSIDERKGILKLFSEDTITAHYDGERQFLAHIHRHLCYAVNYYIDADYNNAQHKVDKLIRDISTAIKEMQTELASFVGEVGEDTAGPLYCNQYSLMARASFGVSLSQEVIKSMDCNNTLHSSLKNRY